MSTIKFPELDKALLQRRYVDELATVEQIASEIGYSVPLVRKRLKLWKIRRGKELIRRGLSPVWNRGMTKETDARLANWSVSRSGDGNPMAGRAAWNSGLTAEKDERVAAVAAALRGREASEETRSKMADAKRGRVRELANRWRGGVSKVGPYREFRKTVEGRRVYIHRYVAEQCLGRMLESEEHVHHIDRDEANNSPENLLVLSDSDHAVLHGAIYRGECDTRAEQIDWLKKAGINFLEIK